MEAITEAIGLLVTLYFLCLLYTTNGSCRVVAWQGVTWPVIASVFSKGDNFPFYTMNQFNVLIIGISILTAIELSYPKLFKKIKYVVSFGEQD
tara:strand:+ start:35 stop:313 length:279 start_codon:yes stop_codon:yes gene_type:complete